MWSEALHYLLQYRDLIRLRLLLTPSRLQCSCLRKRIGQILHAEVLAAQHKAGGVCRQLPGRLSQIVGAPHPTSEIHCDYQFSAWGQPGGREQSLSMRDVMLTGDDGQHAVWLKEVCAHTA